jgi:hypothetical protein
MDHLLNQTCLIYKIPSTPGDFGEVTWGASESVACRSVRIMKHRRDNMGNELQISLKLQISQRTVDIGAKIDFESRPYMVVSTSDWRGYDGELFGTLLFLQNYPT